MSSSLQKLQGELHPLERKVLPFLEQHKTLATIREASKLQEAEVLRGLQMIAAKGLASLSEQTIQEYKLLENGERFRKEGFPEKKNSCSSY